MGRDQLLGTAADRHDDPLDERTATTALVLLVLVGLLSSVAALGSDSPLAVVATAAALIGPIVAKPFVADRDRHELVPIEATDRTRWSVDRQRVV